MSATRKIVARVMRKKRQLYESTWSFVGDRRFDRAMQTLATPKRTDTHRFNFLIIFGFPNWTTIISWNMWLFAPGTIYQHTCSFNGWMWEGSATTTKKSTGTSREQGQTWPWRTQPNVSNFTGTWPSKNIAPWPGTPATMSMGPMYPSPAKKPMTTYGPHDFGHSL